MAVKKNYFIYHGALYTFLFFAFIFWPIWIPFITALFETNKKKRLLLRLLLGIGIISALSIVWNIPFYSINAEIMCNHIYYSFGTPLSDTLEWLLSASYTIAVIAPLLISTVPYLRLTGTMVAFSFVISLLAYRMFFISVWCFFAAIISSLVLYSICRMKQ